jgi:KUP system potassium uptake protein
MYDASILKAFSPNFAIVYLVRNGSDGWKLLGGVLLCFTGVEALYADLGAFSRRAVQFSWLMFAFPCLLLGYIGQAAYLADDPSTWTNPFFNTVPPGMFIPCLIIAILAAIVASQAMITAVFQLLSQIMKLSYFPQIRLVHISKIFHGQIYIPTVNWLLMIGTVIVTAVYNNTTRLGQAYGVCVILVSAITTSMVALVATIIWRVPLPIVLFVYLVFAALDGAYLSSALTKVPEGAWFTIVLAVALSSFFILWRFGKENQWRAETSDRFPLSQMLSMDENSSSNKIHNIKLSPEFGGFAITRINGIGIFFDKAGDVSTTPTVFIHFLQKFHAAPDVVVFFHLRAMPVPTASAEERYAVTRCFASTLGNKISVIPNMYRLTICHGYTDEVITPDLGVLVYEQLRKHLICEQNRSTYEIDKDQYNSSSSNHNGTSTPNSTLENETTNPTKTGTDLEQTRAGQKLAELQRVLMIARSCIWSGRSNCAYQKRWGC